MDKTTLHPLIVSVLVLSLAICISGGANYSDADASEQIYGNDVSSEYPDYAIQVTGDEDLQNADNTKEIPAIFYFLSVITVIFVIALVYYIVKVRNK